jgi:uncharacterized membrane protein
MFFDVINRGPGTGWWTGGTLATIIVWVAIALVVALAVRHFGRRHDVPSNDETAIEALKMRFARGEIDASEFQHHSELIKHTK